MAANVLAGEIGIIAEGREYIFRPSFRKLAELSTPEGLVSLFTDVQKNSASGFRSALYVLTTFIDCSTEEAQRLLGFYKDVNGKLRFVRGVIPEPSDYFVLALALLKNGMIGNAEEGSGKAATEFNPLDFVGSAVAHLNLSIDDSWNMTMPELQAAIDAKLGKQKKEKPLTAAEIDAMWEEIDRCRNK